MKRSNLAWAWRPDPETSGALKRGAKKIRDAWTEKGEVLGSDRPHFGGLIESTQPAEKATRRRKMATKNTTNAKTTSTKSETRVPLKRICADLKMEPRLARRKLRNADLSFHDSRDRWSFTKAQVPKVKAILAPAPAAN